jgi:hypothetical protein
LDADERFYPVHRVLSCTGEETPPQEVDWILQQYDFRGVALPNWENISKLGANLHVEATREYNQGDILRDAIHGFNGHCDAVVTCRRHWHDFTFKRPTQNWHHQPDWQMRCIRNHPSIGFDTSTRMHERLIGAGNVWRPDTNYGPFFDHFHFTFKRQEQEQRRHDLAIYDAIHEGRVPPKAVVAREE